MASPSKPLIVVADDEETVCRALTHFLEAWGYRVVAVLGGEPLMNFLAITRPAALLLDLNLGDQNGVSLLPEIYRRQPDLPVIMLTGSGTIDSAVAAMKLGAIDYLTKPPKIAHLKGLLAQILSSPTPKPKPEPQPEGALSRPMWGECAPIQRLRELIANVAGTDATVLVLGENGTGKELVARAVHELSPRRKAPFVAINVAALPRELVESTLFGHEKGAFTGAVQAQQGCCEAADKGTLFLDEIGEMELGLQAKLLRFLQERTVQRVGTTKALPVDVRIVAATNRDPLEQVRKGSLREDLYYRLAVVPVTVPPLRNRGDDIRLLAERFLARAATRYNKNLRGFTPTALAALAAYSWPGNVRQLENTTERAAILCSGSEVDVDLLGGEIEASQTAPQSAVTFSTTAASELRTIDQIEKQAIMDALAQTGGNVKDAAALLGLGQATVYRKIKRYGIVLSERTRVAHLNDSSDE